jgi:hypothetical protein
MITARTASGRLSLRYIVEESILKKSLLCILQDADGKVVGSFVIALPDGRVQTVAYTADHYNGFVAQVTYEGTPTYPELPKVGYGAGQAVRRF